ncbi:hypothetical protein IFM47457_11199 [Aspergillus lentulus]|nr:hypothetical protein IFM47457_11199 [Aspergillus lentulus]
MPLSKEACMQMAITAWKQQKVNVSESSLRKWLAGVKPRAETCANGYKLTVTEEESLVKQLLDADKQGFLIQLEFLCGMA